MAGLPFDPSLVSEPPGALPIDTGVSTGRAADLPARGGGADLSSMLNYEPTTRDRWAAFFKGLQKPGGATEHLATVTEQKRRAGMELLKMQLEFAKAGSENAMKTAQTAKTWGETLRALAPDLALATPERRQAFAKALRQDAQQSTIPTFLTAMSDLIVEQPDLAALAPDFMDFIDLRTFPVWASRLRKGVEEGKGETVFWEMTTSNIWRTLADRMDQMLPSLKEASGDKPLRFDTVAKALTGGNAVLDKFLRGGLTDDHAKVTESARTSLLQRLTQAGVELPSTTEAAQKAGATTLAQEQAKRDPDIVEKDLRIKDVQIKATAATEADPAVIAFRVKRLKAEEEAKAEATKKVELKYRGKMPFNEEQIAGFRDDYLKLSKEFILRRDAFAAIENAALKGGSGQSDIVLMYNFIKLNAPDAVREGELALSQSAASLPERLTRMFENVKSGSKFTPSERQRFYQESKELFQTFRASQLDVETEWRGIAKNRGADPDEAVPRSVIGRFRDDRTVTPKTESLSRKSDDYKKARARGLTEAQIEQRYNLKLTD